MILYGSYTSPYVRHIRVVMAQFEFDYEFVDTDYAASAKASPTQRVPFLEDGGRKLTDSSSILLYLKQRHGEHGFTDIDDFELYTLANTTMDTEINLFLLERDGLTPENSDYLRRQRARVESGLQQLDQLIAGGNAAAPPFTDGQIRLVCLLDWGLFRRRFDIQGHDALASLLDITRGWAPFIDTAPPEH